MKQIKNNTIIKHSLPRTGKLSTGQTVSNYHLLPRETLKAEGWLPVVDNIPKYNPSTQYIKETTYTIGKDSVIKNYIIDAIPAAEPSEFELMQAKIDEQQRSINLLQSELARTRN